MAEAVVAFVLDQLGGFIIESISYETKFLHVVRDQVDKAKDELRRMRCFLKDADARARKGGDERINNWVAEIREAAYDLEDAILTALSSKAIHKEKGFVKAIQRLACLYSRGVELHRLESNIKKVSTYISTLTSSLKTHGISQLGSIEIDGPSSSNDRLRELRRAYSHVVDREIVGFDEDIKKLVSCLTNEKTRNCRVVSICGMGGLGKTTLARKVYQHSQILNHFDCVAWASISQQCQVVSVWKHLLGKVLPEKKNEIKEMDESDVCRKLYEIQEQRKCLIVLDDIWTTKVWDCLSSAFPKDATKSKILLTTRNKDLALYADRNGIIHERQCLDGRASWELFEKVFTVSRSNVEDEKKKKEIGKAMLKDCGGLPFAIIVLQGILSRKQSVFEWEAIQKNAKMYINKGKSPELCNVDDNEGVSRVLGLSYDELPYQMKLCFLHLASFPEDHEIRVSELCKIWMAEGFVSSENTGYEVLHELVQRCMVLKGELSSSYGGGRIKTCRVHDLMRDLCLSKAREENFLQISYSGDISQDESKNLLTRRLAVFGYDVDSNEFLSTTKGDCLRSCMWFKRLGTPEMMIPLFNRFHMLKVLKFEDCTFKIYFPEEVGDLSFLRFLSLKGCDIDPFPSSISKLKYLQTLDLRLRYGPLRLLENITKWRLDWVRHLYLPFDGDISCCKFELGSNVQTLVGIKTSNPIVNHFSHFTNLTKLTLEYDDKLPEASQFPPELIKLTVLFGSCEYDMMPTLEKLPKLRILSLNGDFSNVGKMVSSSGSFPRLQFLRLQITRIKEWEVEEGAFSSLSHLTLSTKIPIPDGLRYVTTLKEIVFKGMETNSVRELKKGRRDFYKVQHVPSLVFNTWKKRARMTKFIKLICALREG